MAGKFLSLEESARRLGISIDEINRLVDRKELFPMRDGATIKFKSDDIERYAADNGVGTADEVEDLTLDLGIAAGGLDDSLAAGPGASGLVTGDPIDDASIFTGDDGGGRPTDSQTVVRGGKPAPAAEPTSGLFDGDDLSLDSLVTASSPSLVVGDQQAGDGSGTLAIDLADLNADSLAGLSGLGGQSGAGGSLALAADSGLSLEGDDLEISGVDLDKRPAGKGRADTAAELSGSLAGDAFDLGAGLAEEESASVVIPTEETGESNFFGDALDESASISFDGSGASGSIPIAELAETETVAAQPNFSVWQVVGLACCTLLLFVGGLVVFDVVATVRSPIGSPVSSPLLNALAQMFGW